MAASTPYDEYFIPCTGIDDKSQAQTVARVVCVPLRSQAGYTIYVTDGFLMIHLGPGVAEFLHGVPVQFEVLEDLSSPRPPREAGL